MILAGVVAAAMILTPAFAIAGDTPEEPPTDDTQPESGITYNVIVQKLLKPADTSSPRATLQSFLKNMNRSYRILVVEQRKETTAPDSITSDSYYLKAKEAERYFTRAVSCLDLSEVPVSLRKEIAYEATLQLKEILDRIDIPPPDLIPEADALEKDARENGFSTIPRWRFPATNIVIGRVEEGPREGEYLFTPRTVARLDDFFSEVKGLPYKPGEFITEGFLKYYLSTPGWLIPPKWSGWLPSWSKHVFLSLTIWRWIALLALVLLWFWVLKESFRALLFQTTANSPAVRSWKRALFCLVAISTLFVVHLILREHINITGPVFVFLRLILSPIWWLLGAVMTFFATMALAERIIASPRVDPEGIQAAFFRALFGLLGFVGGGAVFIVGLSRIGVSLVPLLTGLGIGGLALALAARPTLESIISSFTIFADNPYRVGERVNVMGHNGIVESIGLRSTKIRLLSEHVTTIPNEKMAAAEVENVSRRTCIRRLFNVTITYVTPPDKIKRAV